MDSLQIEDSDFSRKMMSLVLNTGEDWKRIADDMLHLIFAVDLKFKIIHINKAMLDRFNMTYQEALGHSCFFCVHDREEPLENCLHKQMLLDGKPHVLALYEKRLGGHFEITVVPYYGANGEIVGSVHIARDINDLIQAQQEREGLQRRLILAQKLESVGQLAAGIAHEINTPSQFIGTNINFIEESFKESISITSLLLDFFESIKNNTVTENQIKSIDCAVKKFDWDYLKDEIPEAIRQSKEGLQRITSIVHAMKSFSHPGDISMTDADINQIIKTTVTVSRNEWKYVSVIETFLDPNLHPITCLVDEISQVILNLLINAAHAIEGKIGRNPELDKGIITVTTKQYVEYIEIRISDTGAGIPESIHGKIFDPFFTTKEIGKGTGQGLALAHDVIFTKHKGTITFESEVGVGTTFIIQLPVNPVAGVNALK
jgi:PAS domain S-box-containing protein